MALIVGLSVKGALMTDQIAALSILIELCYLITVYLLPAVCHFELSLLITAEEERKGHWRQWRGGCVTLN